MKIAITGATGHIGNNLCRFFIQKGASVRALYRNKKWESSLNGLPLKKYRGDILDMSFLKNAFAEVDYVIHAAGMISIDGDPVGMVYKTNVEGTRNVVHAAIKTSVKRVIHISSIHALKYSAGDALVTEDHPLADKNSFAYDYSKAMAEVEILNGISKGLDAVILNPTAIIGPYDFRPSRTGQFFLNLYHIKLPALVTGGFDWVDIRDVAQATLSAIQHGKKGERYILSGKWASFANLSQIVKEVTEVKTTATILPVWMARLGLPFLQGYAKVAKIEPLYTYESLMIIKHSNQNFSSEKAERALGFTTRPLPKSIAAIYDWFYDNNKLTNADNHL